MTTPPIPGLPQNLGMNSGSNWQNAWEAKLSQAGGLTSNPGSYGSTFGANKYGRRPGGQDLVYFGIGKQKKGPGPGPYAPGFQFPLAAAQPDAVPYQDAIMQPRDWDEKQLRSFVNKGILYKIPGFDEGMGMPEIMSAWQDLVNASWMLTDDKKQVSPWQVMETYAPKKGAFGTITKDGWVFDVATGERLAYKGPLKKTTTHKELDLSSPEEVKALTTQVLREALGRAPTDKELAQFRSSINSMEKATPRVTTTTTTIRPNLQTGELETVGSESQTTGGIEDAARVEAVQSAAMEKPEYGKYQSGTTYYNALLQMITGGF